MSYCQTEQRLLDAVRATVAYADVFDFPLDVEEIQRDLVSMVATPAETRQGVALLVNSGALALDQGYPVLPGREGLARLRQERQRRAAALWPLATRYGRWLAALPFVQMVAVSGSLAANNPDPRADLDYLIVTVPGRLWLVRALAIVLVRFARRRGVQLCPNYLLTTNVLALNRCDLYTAHELLQAEPIAGLATYQELLARNTWAAAWLPNRYQLQRARTDERRTAVFMRRAGEFALGGALGDRLEAWEGARKQARFSGGNGRYTSDMCEGYTEQTRQRVLGTLAARCAELGIPLPTLADLEDDTAMHVPAKSWAEAVVAV